VTLRRTILVIGAATLVCRTAPAATPALLEYEVRAAESGTLLHRVSGWTERAADDRRVTAASRAVFPNGAVLEQRASFAAARPPAAPRCLDWEWSVVDAAGSVAASGRGRCVAAAFPFLARPLPADAYPSYPPYALLGFVSTHLGLGESRRSASYEYVLMDASLVRLDLRVERRERVEVPAGSFDCYRVRMRPDVRSILPDLPRIVAAFASFFAPTPTFWITAGEPQTLVKFAGIIGPPRSPDVVIELARVTPRDGERLGEAASLVAR